MNNDRTSRKRGQGLVEYSLIIVLVAVVLVVVVGLVGSQISLVFARIIAGLAGPAGAPPPPECYGTLLLPLMMGVTGSIVILSSLLARVQRPSLS